MNMLKGDFDKEETLAFIYYCFAIVDMNKISAGFLKYN